jgi:hypothetical protein
MAPSAVQPFFPVFLDPQQNNPGFCVKKKKEKKRKMSRRTSDNEQA